MTVFEKIKQHVSATIESIRENPRGAMVTAAFFLLLILIFWHIAGIFVGIVVILFFTTYSTAMNIGKKANRKYNELAPTGTLTEKQTLLLSVQNGMLIYWYWFIVSLIPITTYESWFIIGLPITILSYIPLKELANRNKKKYRFWLIMIVIYLSLFGIGQLIALILT